MTNLYLGKQHARAVGLHLLLRVRDIVDYSCSGAGVKVGLLVREMLSLS